MTPAGSSRYCLICGIDVEGSTCPVCGRVATQRLGTPRRAPPPPPPARTRVKCPRCHEVLPEDGSSCPICTALNAASTVDAADDEERTTAMAERQRITHVHGVPQEPAPRIDVERVAVSAEQRRVTAVQGVPQAASSRSDEAAPGPDSGPAPGELAPYTFTVGTACRRPSPGVAALPIGGFVRAMA
jgi:RNA polymerase subunit RPABC4/transcription elongation factor Spt4